MTYGVTTNGQLRRNTSGDLCLYYSYVLADRYARVFPPEMLPVVVELVETFAGWKELPCAR